MKKLLALVLCVMLLVSVIPTAFAEEAESIDLSELYAAVDNLYLAYNNLGYATLVFNFNAGFGDAVLEYNALDNPVSYEGLFQIVGPDIYTAYNELGQEVIDDCAEIIQEFADALTEALNALVA